MCASKRSVTVTGYITAIKHLNSLFSEYAFHGNCTSIEINNLENIDFLPLSYYETFLSVTQYV